VIVLPDGEFPANVHAWLGLERAHGFRVERVPLDERGCPDEEALLDRVRRGDVCALAISAVQFNTGYRADLEALGAACAAHDVLFVVDAIQAVGVTPLDVVAARIDVLACGGQKWLCGPFGTGFAYVRRDLVHDYAPELPGWLAFESSLDFPRLLEYRLDLWDDARRFETGSLGLQGFVGLAAAAELIDELGVHAIAAHVAALHEPLMRWALDTPGVRVPVAEPDRRAGVLAVHVNDAAVAQRALQAARITIVPPDGALRFAPHFYNTHDDIAAAVDVLNTLHAAT
jgi:cysteine desulfurase / selenocysteine lyase